jgi:hypothetical protein
VDIPYLTAEQFGLIWERLQDSLLWVRSESDSKEGEEKGEEEEVDEAIHIMA